MNGAGKYPNTFYRVACKAIIRNDKGELLVVKENGSEWDLPGGGWDHGETARDCLARELFEEVAFRGEFDYQAVGAQPFYLPDKQAWLLWLLYEVTPRVVDESQFTPGEHAEAMTWLDVANWTDAQTERGRWIHDNL